MESGFFQKAIIDINFLDVKRLVDDKYPESYDLDYKEDYPNNKKLAKLMIALANAAGGFIIIGVKEEKVNSKNTGIPESIVGIAKEDHSIKITQIALAYSQPKIIPQVKVIEREDDPDTDMVIVKINEAIEPIMYYSANDSDSNKFFIRINDKIEPADQPLLKKLFARRPFYEQLEELEGMISQDQEETIEDYELNFSNPIILFGINIIPLNNDIELIDITDHETENQIKKLNSNFLYRNPIGRMVEFSELLRNFNFMGDHYVSKFVLMRELAYNKSEIKIFRNGNIFGEIIYQTEAGKDVLERVHIDYDEISKDELKSTAYLNKKIIPYMLIMWLKLAKLIYDQKFFGRFKFKFRILSTNDLIIDVYDCLQKSHTDDIIIEQVIYSLDLDDKVKIKELLYDFLKVFLRYFGYDLDDLNKKISIFDEIINDYFDVTFK